MLPALSDADWEERCWAFHMMLSARHRDLFLEGLRSFWRLEEKWLTPADREEYDNLLAWELGALGADFGPNDDLPSMQRAVEAALAEHWRNLVGGPLPVRLAP